MSRDYRKEYDNYHSRPEQKIRRAARNAARRLFADADPDKDVHHKDNNPLNNDKKNLSLVTQHYNRREPRLRKEENPFEANAISMSNPNAKRMVGLMQKYINTKDKRKKAALLKDINKYQKMLGLKVTEDMGTTTGAHIAGTGDDSSTVIVKKKKKKKVYRRESLKKRIIDNVLAIQQKI